MAIQEVTGQSINQMQTTSQNQAKKQFIEQENTSIHNIKERMQMTPEYMPTMGEKTIIDTIEQANKKLEGANREFEFSIHEKTKQIMVKVVDTATKEVVREIPSEKILDMVAAMCENAGLFVDEKV